MSASNETPPIRALHLALRQLIGRQVVTAIAPAVGANPIVTFSGVLEGAIDSLEHTGVSIVIGGQHLTLWPEQLQGLEVVRDPREDTFQLQLPEGPTVTFHAIRH